MYILFFSSNCYNGDLYDVSYATSVNGIRNNGGEYQKSSAPLLLTGYNNGKLFSPGGLDVGPGGVNVLFHADKVRADAGVRQMWAGQIRVDVGARTVSI